MPRPPEAGQRAPKINKACVPCRLRKVKCDAAAIGLPCSSCTSRQSAEDCVLPTRKDRAKKEAAVSVEASPRPTTRRSISNNDNDNEDNPSSPVHPSKRAKRQQDNSAASDPGLLNHPLPPQTEPDLLYLDILNDAVKETRDVSQKHSSASSPYLSRSDSTASVAHCRWLKVPHLDDVDNDYLVKRVSLIYHLVVIYTLVRTYFDRVYPFAPVISRADFVRRYQSGDCSLFLLRAILTPASLHAPSDVLSACGFASRAAAQESLFHKTKLLHDFSAEQDPLALLQGCIVLSMVILDHPTDWDFTFWFHNSVRLATKLGIHNSCIREDKPSETLKLYRRIWWALYFFDIFHVVANPRRSRLFDGATIKPRSEDDWEDEDAEVASSGFLSKVTPVQKALPVAYCKLSQIFGHCLTVVTSKPLQDPRPLLQPLDVWRRSLATTMHIEGDTGTDVYYLNVQATSYRFECILCRKICRCWQQSQKREYRDWAKKRQRNAVLELDTIATRVLANGTIHDFPVSFVTTITALLALHIESALDASETDLARSMARISIHQAMLILRQGKDIPALTRALPVFEDILSKRNLFLVEPPVSSQAIVQPSQTVESNSVNGTAQSFDCPPAEIGLAPSQLDQGDNISTLFYEEFLGLDFLDDWQVGQLDFSEP